MTLRELDLMAEARRREDWSHTANIMTILAEINRNPKKRAKPYVPSDFCSLLKQSGKRKDDKGQRVMVPITILRDIFVRNGRRRQ